MGALSNAINLETVTVNLLMLLQDINGMLHVHYKLNSTEKMLISTQKKKNPLIPPFFCNKTLTMEVNEADYSKC